MHIDNKKIQELIYNYDYCDGCHLLDEKFIMIVTYIKSACVIVECNGTRIMCDPWLVDGIYYGSWFHYPPLTIKPEELFDVDYIYISHIHPDHLDVKTLQLFPKSVPVLIHNFAEKFVFNILKKLGFENIHEISHKDDFELCPGFNMEILAADNCNPAICGRYFNCNVSSPYTKTQQIDTLAVFHGNGKTVVNSNDCPYPLSQTVCDDILKKYGSVDFLLVGYRGAGPYPQCFDNLDEEGKSREAIVHRDKMMAMSVDYIRHLRPKAFLPFAGQYVLGGKLAGLNRFILPNLEDLLQLYPSLLAPHGVTSKMVLLNSGESYDLEREDSSAPFVPPNNTDRQIYIDDVLSKIKFDYELDEAADKTKQSDLTSQLETAIVRMHAHQKHFGDYATNWNVYLDTGQNVIYRIPFELDRHVEKITPDELQEPFLRISVDYPLMVRILNRKAHWNNAEIGSHLRYYRQPNEFQRTIHFLLSYLQC